jgi:hypothetical protein
LSVYTNSLNESSIIQNYHITDGVNAYYNEKYQMQRNQMKIRTDEIISILRENGIQESQLIRTPVLFRLKEKTDGSLASLSDCALFNPINSVYMIESNIRKVIFSGAASYMPYCSYYTNILSSIGYDSNTVFFLESTVLQSSGGGSIHCGTILKRER